MTTYTTLIAITLVAAATAAPFGEGALPRCSTQCSVAAAKFAYLPHKIYSYELSGGSVIDLKGVPRDHPNADWTWKSTVELTFLSPCDVVVSYQHIQSEGDSKYDAETSKYPLMAAINDGRVERVCIHPDDEAWAVNTKKGMLSHIQNSLPSLFKLKDQLNLTETDTVGKCRTQYSVEGEGNHFVVTKEKNLRHCQERYLTSSKTHMPLLGSPFPIQESWNKCKQEINNGIITSVNCEDKNIVKPMLGSYKYIEATQKSSLQYKSVRDGIPEYVSTLTQDGMIVTSLTFDYRGPKKEESLVPGVEQELESLCQSMKEAVQEDTAAKVDHLIELLRLIPHQAIPQLLQKIRSKQICSQNPKIEGLFLDIMARVKEAGAVKVMVDEIVSGKVSLFDRVPQYTMSLYLMPRPCIHSISALKPLFESDVPTRMTKLAAGSMVNTYCRHHPRCYEEPEVISVVQALSSKIQSQCTSSPIKPHPALTSLKTLANTGVVTSEMSQSVLSCMEADIPDINVRVAAAQTFRLAKCHSQVTERLVNFAVNPVKNTEVRIAAYLAAVPCAKHQHLKKIVDKISVQPNTQVRGFILSHLTNLQQSDAPEKQHLRYNLTDIVVPMDFKADLRKYSRNVDLSYFMPSLGVGAGLESNLIYVPGSFIPRSLDLNLASALDSIPFNIGELGARIEGLEPLVAKTFGPDGYFAKSSYEKILKDAIQLIQEKGSKIKEEILKLRQRRSVDYSVVTNLLKSLYDNLPAEVQADVFARLMGQELTFGSWVGDLKDVKFEDLVQKVLFFVVDKLPNVRNIDLDTSRMFQWEYEYFFPTSQGTPLEVRVNTTVVAALKLKSLLPSIVYGWPQGQNLLDIKPSLSRKMDVFIGFGDDMLKSGLKFSNTISTATGAAIKVTTKSDTELQVELDIPEKMDLIKIKYGVYFMMKKRGSPDTKIIPSDISDIRSPVKSCIGSQESVLGLKLCYDFDIPDFVRSESMPLTSRPAFAKLYIEKADAGMKGYKTDLTFKQEGNKKILAGKLVTKASSPKEAEIEAVHTKEQDHSSTELKVKSSSFTGTIGSHVTAQGSQQNIEFFTEIASSNTRISKAIKLDVRDTSSGQSTECNFKLSKSESRQYSPESVLFEGKYKSMEEPRVVLEVDVKTKNALREYMLLDFQFAGEAEYIPNSQVPLPTKLDTHLEAGIPSLKVVSSVRKSESGQGCKYESNFKIVDGSQEPVAVEASVNLQGVLGTDFVATTSVDGKVGRLDLRSHSTIELSYNKKAVTLQIVRRSDNKKILDLETAVQYTQPRFVVFKVESELISNGIKFEAKAAEERQDQYQVNVQMVKSGQSLIHIQGPVTIIFTPDVTKLQLDISASTQHRLAASYIVQENKHEFGVQVKSPQRPLVVLEWNVKLQSESGVSDSSVKVLLAELIDASVAGVVRGNVIHFSTNTHILPSSGIARRIKAFTDLNLDSNQYQAEVSWNADHEPNKKLSVQAKVISVSTQPPQAAIQSEVVFEGRAYRVKLDLQPRTLLIETEGEGSFKVEVTTPEQKTHKLDSDLKLQLQQQSVKIDSITEYTSPESRKYNIFAMTGLEKCTGPYGFKLDSKLGYKTPEGHENSVALQTSHESSPQERKIQLKSTVEAPSLSQPVILEGQMIIQDTSYKVKFTKEANQAATMFNGELEVFPEGGVKTFDTAIDMNAIQDLLKEVTRVSGMNLIQTSYNPSQESNFRFRYHKPETDTHTMLLQSHSRSMEAQAKISPAELIMEVYPNRHMSDAKYKMSSRSSHSLFGSTYEVRISHPSLSKEMVASMEYTATGSEETRQGSFELDIFPDTADKFTGTLRSKLTANNTIKIDVELQSRVLPTKPKVSVEGSYSPDTKAFSFKLHKTPSSPVSFEVGAKYDKLPLWEVAMALYVKKKQHPVVELTYLVKPQARAHCYGVKVEGKVRTSISSDIDIESDLCKPGFISITTKKPEATQIYITKFGIQSPNRAEFSVSESDKSRLDKRPISVLGVELVTPSHLKFKYGGSAEEARTTKEFVFEEARKVVRELKNSAIAVYHQVQEEAAKKGIHFPSAELLKLTNEISEELSQLSTGFHTQVVKPVIDSISVVISKGHPIVKELDKYVRNGLKLLHDLYSQSIVQSIRDLRQYYPTVSKVLTDVVVQTAQWVKTGEEPTVLHEMVQNVKESSLAQVIKTLVLQKLESRYPEQYRVATDIVDKIMTDIYRDSVKVHQYLNNLPSSNFITSAIISTVSNEDQLNKVLADLVLSQVVKMTTGLEGDERINTLTVPLYRPLYSLSQTTTKIIKSPVKMLMGTLSLNTLPKTYYKWLPISRLLPPFNGTALIVNSTHISTFDGALLRAPPSHCKLILVSIPDVVRITMLSPQPDSPPQIDYHVGQDHASISPTYIVTINGQQVNGERKVSPFTVKSTPSELKVVTPIAGIDILKEERVIMVSVSGWTFNHTQGLLGSYDHEVANDRYTPSGKNASSMQELVKSWQEDLHCAGPDVTNDTNDKLMRTLDCGIVITKMEPCFSVIDCKPFLEQCLDGPSLCPAMRAYHSACVKKHVILPDLILC